MERAFRPLAMKNVSIKHLQLFEDRSDAACRFVYEVLEPHFYQLVRLAIVFLVWEVL